MSQQPFDGIQPPLLPFRDASSVGSTFDLTVLDCLHGLERAIEYGWFDLERFNIRSYEHFAKVENGDLNWVIPGKFIAFPGPNATPIDSEGYPCFTPEDYVDLFRAANIGLVVRLNANQYDARRFICKGIKHVDLFFEDGSCPSPSIVSKFLLITESTPCAVGVHCKAGLGRTGTLIGLYAMKHYFCPARAFIAWNRLCRPGSILGPQQHYLIGMQEHMFQAGMATRRQRITNNPQDATERVFLEQYSSPRGERSQTSDEHPCIRAEQSVLTAADLLANNHEDVGQGERLCNAKRNALSRQAVASSPNRPVRQVSNGNRVTTPRSPARCTTPTPAKNMSYRSQEVEVPYEQYGGRR